MYVGVPGRIRQAVEVHACQESRLRSDLLKGEVIEVGPLPFSLRRVADIREAGPQDKRTPIQVMKEAVIYLFGNQDMCGWPGHGHYFTWYAREAERFYCIIHIAF